MKNNNNIKKVAIFCDFLNSLGGCEYYNVLLAKCLASRGIEVRVYIGEKPRSDHWIKELAKDNIYFRTPKIFHTNLEDRTIETDFILKYTEDIKKWSPDIIHTHPFGKLAISWLENKTSNKKIPIVVTEYTTPSSNTLHWFNKEYGKYSSHISAYIATCRAVELGVKKYFGYKGKIIRIPHLVVLGKDENINFNNIFSVGCIARLSPEKGLSSLILAWYFLSKKNPKATLCIYGTGMGELYLKGLVNSLNLGDKIIFKGAYKPYVGINKVVKRHQLFIQPSHFESIPTTLIELMLRQRIVLASNVGGVSEIIKNNKNGFVYKNGSVESLAETLNKIFKKKKKNLRDIAINARTNTLKTYNLKNNIDAIIKLYNDLI
ncbi:MAG: glycosyltransferase family 4 protein [Candidatus Zambryskibacteria bacterium]|nr:glycosyltransferase family 4 protein [Candidatus Zambryskibacteria bacterium]